MMNSTPPLNVSMEVTDEFMVQEIYPDGTEIYKQPLTMSENFTRIIQRIDFEKLSTMLGDEPDSEKKDFEIPEVAINVSSYVNPTQRSVFSNTPTQFDSIKAKIMNALTNISVMHDVIKIGRDQEFLVIDRVADLNKISEEKLITILIAKKRALAQAAQIISSAYERLQNEQTKMARGRIDFHMELLAMRQQWRLRKKGSVILGDLSYRSAGSSFNQHGAFEVVRNESQSPKNPSSLRVVIPKALEGRSFFVVRTIKDSNFQSNKLFEPLKLSNPPLLSASSEQPCHSKLESAQTMLFNNELFQRIARESVQLKLSIPIITAGNQIIASLFPGLQLSINLCHSTANTPGTSTTTATPFEPSSNNPVLEHTMHQLLHKVHYQKMHHPLPHPASSTLTIFPAKYFAGPRAFSKKTLSSISQNKTILEQVIQQGQHSMLRLRTMCLIDSLAIEIPDPLIIPHWSYLNSPTHTSVRVDLYSYGYESLTGCRTSVMLHIETRSVKAILRDGRVLNLSFESQELRHLLLNLISQHQISAVQSLAKATGWKMISLTPQTGVGKQEPIYGTSSSIVLISPNSDQTLTVKSGPHSGIKVKLSSAPQEFFPSNLVNNPQWEQLNGPFKIVDLKRLPGKTFVNKMEYLMACLSAKT